jgi:hypothetical protein
MLDRADARRPAQVNACFEGGTDRKAEILDALHQTGLGDDQITVIDRATPEDITIETAEPSLIERIKGLFGGDNDDEDAEKYDLLILAHLGRDENLAGPVQEVFERFGAARVNYYAPAAADMRPLGGGGSLQEIERELTGAGRADAAPAGAATPPAGSATTREGERVEPGGLGPATETHVRKPDETGAQASARDTEEAVYRAPDPQVTVDETRQGRADAARGGTQP